MQFHVLHIVSVNKYICPLLLLVLSPFQLRREPRSVTYIIEGNAVKTPSGPVTSVSPQTPHFRLFSIGQEQAVTERGHIVSIWLLPAICEMLSTLARSARKSAISPTRPIVLVLHRWQQAPLETKPSGRSCQAISHAPCRRASTTDITIASRRLYPPAYRSPPPPIENRSRPTQSDWVTPGSPKV